MVRNYFFLWTAVFLLTLSCQQRESNPKNPNIIILFSDDQRSTTINFLGNDEIVTPNLDRLAKSGLTFNNAYIMGGTSAAVCAPSRAMLMTGKSLYHLNKQGDWNYPIEAADTTFPELLRRKGYKTCGIGKQHNGKEVFGRGFSNAGHIMFGGMSSHYDIPVYDFSYDSVYLEERGYHVVDKHSTELYTDDAIRFIETYDEEQPFLLYIAFQAPHDPREMPESFKQLYDVDKLSTPPNFLPHHPFDNGELLIRDEMLAEFPRSEEEIKTHIRDYYAMITHLDSEIGKILNVLEEQGFRDNTLVVFSSDNGLAVGQHGLMGKQNLYEHSIKVPLIFSGPGIPVNQKTDAFVYIHDLYPTLCDILNFESPGSVESLSFHEVIMNPELPHRETMVYGYRDFQRAVRKGNWKLIEYFVNGEHTTQLFNLAEDPYEKRNLVEFAGNRQKTLELRELLIKTSTEIDDVSEFWSWLE